MEEVKSAPPDLAELFDFTPNDLQANAQGHLSDRQKERFEGSGVNLAHSLFVAVSVTAAVFLTTQELVYFFCTAPWAGMAIYSFWKAMDTNAKEVGAGLVKEASGEVIQHLQRRNQVPLVQVGNALFEVSRQECLALRAGICYHVYYLPHTRRIVSASPCDMLPDNPFTEPSDS